MEAKVHEKMTKEWVALVGSFQFDGTKLICKGGGYNSSRGDDAPRLGIFLTNELFYDGVVNTVFEFSEIDGYTSCEVVLHYNTTNKNMLLVGLNSMGPMYQVSKFEEGREYIGGSGIGSNLQKNKKYNIEILKKGSVVEIKDGGIRVLSLTLPTVFDESNIGISVMSKSDVIIHEFSVAKERPKAFVVMQFTEPYNQYYSDIIKKVCADFGVDVKRADEHFGTGMVLADIVQDIIDSKFIIADISEINPNVYYEIGYAHALNKPTIILAEKGTKLPFDISPFRVLFYENTIIGKSKFEDGLRSHLSAMVKI
jgi:hypothetical protein